MTWLTNHLNRKDTKIRDDLNHAERWQARAEQAIQKHEVCEQALEGYWRREHRLLRALEDCRDKLSSGEAGEHP